MDLTQENRAMNIDTPLGGDVLLLTGLKGTEGISVPFRYDLDLISGESDIEFAEIVGKSVNVSIELADGGERLINGIVTYFSKADAGVTDPGAKRTYPYRATFQPAFWLLSLTGDCKIFQNLTALEIVEKIFQEHKIKYKNNTNDSYSKREYCVQYNESDFRFICRLLEEEGIFYYFEHEEGLHTIVLVDKNEQILPCPDHEIVKYCLNLKGIAEEDTITSLECDQHIGPTGFAIEDFNFKTPNTDLEANAPALQKFGDMDLEIYCYPGDYETKKEGMKLVDLRMEEEEAHAAVITGSSRCRALQSGYHFELKQFYREAMNSKKYLLTSVRHIVSQSFEEGGEFHYANIFTCIPHTMKYRPLRTTHKPVMQGSQTATVSGPKGDEIYVDEHGRVKVQFHWDRYGKKDENTTCWIRVSYPSASSGFGFQSHPRIGDEVIVDFLEGDPDRPIITGGVYNGANPVAYKLPDHKTRSYIRSNSTIGGGGYNEIRFEDKKGSEEVYFQAEKDWNLLTKNDKGQTVGNNETLTVVNNRTKSVGVDQMVTIGSNHTESIGSNKTITIGSCKTETVMINTAETIGVAKELTIGGLYQVTVGAAMNETIGAAKAEEIGAAKSVNVGLSSSENIGVNKSVDVGSNIMQNAGKNISLTAGENYSVKAGKNGIIDICDKLVIKCGSASITMSKNGDITIEGKNINVKGSGNIVMKANKITQN